MSLSVFRGPRFAPGVPTAPRGAPVTSLVSGGQRRHGVEFLERPGVRVERQRGDHAGQLVEQIDEAVVGRNDQVTRPRTLLELEDRRRVRGEPSALFIEEELEHLVGLRGRRSVDG
jgi:hypothetical protein